MRTYIQILTIFFFLIILLALPLAARGAQEAADDGKLTVAVSILPHQAAVDAISGGLANSVVLVGEGQSPHSYEPTPRQMSALAAADLWLLSGTDFETALRPKVVSLYPDLALIDGTEGVAFRHMDAHSHEGEEDQEETLDLHTWLGKDPYLIFIDHAVDALSEADPANRETYRKNGEAYKAEITREFNELGKELAGNEGRTVLVFHPSFGYFLDEFSLKQEGIETGGKEPTARVLSQIIDEAVTEGVSTVFVQKQFPVSAAETIAKAIGGRVVGIDPLSYNWLDNIREIGTALKESFQ